MLTIIVSIIYVFTQTLCYRQDVTQGQFLSGVKLVWIQSFPVFPTGSWSIHAFLKIFSMK